jgi:antitoxin (DNA-binding transcriptional repressor) of toxin-antitoxin stability system
METIGVRQLQQHAAAAVRRVERGEVLGITARGRLVAVLAPPESVGGVAALVAAGRVRRGRQVPLPEPIHSSVSTAEVLDDLRGE